MDKNENERYDTEIMEQEIWEVMKAAGHEFHEYRVAHHISVTQISMESGVSKSEINYLEGGRKRVSFLIVQKVCMAMHFSVQKFLLPGLRWAEELDDELREIIRDVRSLNGPFRKAFYEIALAVLDAFRLIIRSIIRRP